MKRKKKSDPIIDIIAFFLAVPVVVMVSPFIFIYAILSAIIGGKKHG